jgi:hypothetical protein
VGRRCDRGEKLESLSGLLAEFALESTLDPREELALLNCHLDLPLSLDGVEDGASEDRAHKPAHCRRREDQAQRNHGVKRQLVDQRVGRSGGQEHGPAGAAREGSRCAKQKLPPSSRFAELEKRVPIERRLGG